MQSVHMVVSLYTHSTIQCLLHGVHGIQLQCLLYIGGSTINILELLVSALRLVTYPSPSPLALAQLLRRLYCSATDTQCFSSSNAITLHDHKSVPVGLCVAQTGNSNRDHLHCASINTVAAFLSVEACNNNLRC
jgi:hypothetical protein